MDWAYHYRDPDRLYLNVTNRCTNRCGFCVRSRTARLGDGLLLGGEEPDLGELLDAVEARGGPERYREIVWCGYGEPTMRLDLILAASPVFRSAGAAVRLNTNGHGCLIHGRDVLSELGETIDKVNVSLNAPTQERYLEICAPDPLTLSCEPAAAPAAFWDAMRDFLTRAPSFVREVGASVVGDVLAQGEIDRCREIAREMAGAPLRLR
jgi:TatD DNase family protein